MRASVSRVSVAKKQPYKRSQVVDNSGGSMVIKHREIVDTLNGSGYSTPTKIVTFQPGELRWLSPFAMRFEHYEVLAAKLVWTTASSANSAGSVLLRVDYDCLDDAPLDTESMEAGGNCATGVIWQDLTLNIRPGAIVPKRKFMRVGAAPATSDERMYDAFTVWMVVTGQCYGRVYVDYTVRLFTPQLQSTPGGIVRFEGSGFDINTTTGVHTLSSNAVATSLGPIPASVRLPTDSEVGLGAYSGAKGLEILPNWQGIMTAVSALTPDDNNDSLTMDAFGDLTFTASNDTATDGSSNMQRSYKVESGSRGGFMAPTMTSLNDPISLVLRFAKAAHDSL